MKRLAWAFGCAKKDSDEESELYRALVGKLNESRHTVKVRPAMPDADRVDAGDYTRAAGDAVCEVCSYAYFEHDHVRGFEWLRRTCDGRLVKL